MLRKINLGDEKPLIQINWRKIWKYCKRFIGGIIWIIKKIIKIILEILILLMRLFLWLRKKVFRIIKVIFLALKRFSKRKKKGIWILFLIAILLIISLLGLWHSYAMKSLLRKQQESNLEFLQENEELKYEIEEKDKQLETKAKEKAKFAQQQWILTNRDKAEKTLPKEVKTLIAQYANIYGVKDTGLIECIISKESGGSDEAVGDNGSYIGVAQYNLGTFLGHRRQMGLPQVDLRKDTEASIEAMLFSISRGGIGNWPTKSKCI